MKKILSLILIFAFFSCEDKNSSNKSIEYATAKLLKYCYNNADVSIDYCNDWSWNGNTVKITRDGEIIEERTYNEYGFVTQDKNYNSDGSVNDIYNYTIIDKWKITKFEIIDQNGVREPWTYSWEGNTLKRYRPSDNSLQYENVYDDHFRLLKYTSYNSGGSVNYEDEQIWDQAYRYRGLSRTRSTYKNVNNPEGYIYKIVWDGDSNVYTRYSSDGSVSYTSTQTVNKYDQPIIRTYDDEGGKYYTYEWGDAFKSYSRSSGAKF